MTPERIAVHVENFRYIVRRLDTRPLCVSKVVEAIKSLKAAIQLLEKEANDDNEQTNGGG